jgi:hypothetical protein
MKKLLYTGLLGFAALTLMSAPVQAHTFGLFIHHRCCRCCDKCSVCIRPYNAFTPVISGNLVADGCFPFSGAGGNGGPGACAPLCAVGETCAAATPESSAEMAAAQYQYLMYQQQMAAQYQQQMTVPPTTPYGPIQSTGYVPGYNYFGR